jgi:phospholipid/cholesterol/gamma-HCH transport system permease protein
MDGRLEKLPVYSALETLHGCADLAVRIARAVVRPRLWARDCLQECSLGLRRCLPPLILSMSFFAVGLIIAIIGGIIATIGTSDRMGAAMAAGWPRETAYWVTGMVFAGVLGSSMTADLGASKIREELDALRVLGVDPIVKQVVPRAMALVILAPILGLIAMLDAIGLLYLVAPHTMHNLTPAVYLDVLKDSVNTADLLSFILRLIVTGAIVGIVAAYKGLNASGGTEGVGRAVNQSVVITFIGIWLLNCLWNAVFLASFPVVQSLRG